MDDILAVPEFNINILPPLLACRFLLFEVIVLCICFVQIPDKFTCSIGEALGTECRLLKVCFYVFEYLL